MDFWWYRSATALAFCVFFFEFFVLWAQKLEIDTFVETHMYKLLENATVDFLFLFENIILLG